MPRYRPAESSPHSSFSLFPPVRPLRQIIVCNYLYCSSGQLYKPLNQILNLARVQLQNNRKPAFGSGPYRLAEPFRLNGQRPHSANHTPSVRILFNKINLSMQELLQDFGRSLRQRNLGNKSRKIHLRCTFGGNVDLQNRCVTGKLSHSSQRSACPYETVLRGCESLLPK